MLMATIKLGFPARDILSQTNIGNLPFTTFPRISSEPSCPMKKKSCIMEELNLWS
jgi:hypothetical protein